jgi:hypothetical protein
MTHESEHSQNFSPLEDKTPQGSAQEASGLLNKIKGIEGDKKALVIIVDDVEYKRIEAERFLTESSTTRDTHFVISSKEDGKSAIELYQAIRRQEQQNTQEQSRVIVMLDGDLDDFTGVYKYGYQVANKLVELSTANQWEMPYLVGMSSTNNYNQILRNNHPQNYIDTFDDWPKQKAALLDAIDSRLTPPQTPSQK